MLAQHDLDPARDLLPVAPALHYAMGGISTDLAGRSTRTGLWACGEVASTGVHGANRLASNSLLEGLVFADRVARDIEESGTVTLDLPEELEHATPERDDAEPDAALADTRAALRRIMTRDVGVQRSEASLMQAEHELSALNDSTPRQAWRTRNQLLVARLITRAALERRESRGGHARLDYPAAPSASAVTELP